MGRAGYGWRERRRFPRREGTHPRATSLTRIVADRVQRCKESRSPRLSEQSFPRIECRRRASSLATSTQSSPTREDATMSNLPPEYLRASVRKQLRPSGSDHRPTERPLRPPKGCRHPGRREWRSDSQFPRKSSLGFPAHSQPFNFWSQAMRTRGIQDGERDVNHYRVSVPGMRALSQQRRTSFNHYESAWRTANTGSNPVGATT